MKTSLDLCDGKRAEQVLLFTRIKSVGTEIELDELDKIDRPSPRTSAEHFESELQRYPVYFVFMENGKEMRRWTNPCRSLI
jgi:hypothetical protein